MGHFLAVLPQEPQEDVPEQVLFANIAGINVSVLPHIAELDKMSFHSPRHFCLRRGGVTVLLLHY